ncbi:hypothetical protein I5803_18855 [Caenimonas sp. DR4.4]|uniref:DUF306 domain-containing protein n=2 Tax=Caenimonas aquaedulcis TaxID=2793270 RepID=A0A931H7H3_9BURK|nr:hypothetical protein [Caenimonas aquaedulcis]
MNSLAIVVLLCGGVAHAQSSLGQLLDGGAVKLSPAEVHALGDVRFVRKTADADAYMAMRADGTVVGVVHNKQGHGSSEAIGTWQVDAAGRRCANVELPAFRMQMTQCGFTYRLGGDIYFSASDSDRHVVATHYAGPAFLE